MREKNEDELYRTLSDEERLLVELDPGQERYSVDSIIEELLREDYPSAEDSEELSTETEEAEKEAAAPPASATPDADDFPFAQVASEAIDEVRGEEDKESKPSSPSRRERALLKRRERQKARESRREEQEATTAKLLEAEPAEDEPEPPYAESLANEKARYLKINRRFLLSLIPSLCAVPVILLHHFRVLSLFLYTAVSGGLVLCSVLLALPVLSDAAAKLRERVFGIELTALLTALSGLADGALCLLGIGSEHTPLLALSCPIFTALLCGGSLYAGARKDCFQLPALGDASYSVLSADGKIQKKKIFGDGFTRCVYGTDTTECWTTLLLPLIAGASAVFALLTALAHGVLSDFFFFFSVLLTVGMLLPMPLATALPFARLSDRLKHSGVALAGYRGAFILSRHRNTVLSDRDLFPPGTVALNGMKIFGKEDLGKVLNYAATLAHRSESGIAELFDDLLVGNGGSLQSVENFSYSEYGGVSGIIHGETSVLGTREYLRHLNLPLPKSSSLTNVLFLAIDGMTVAAFPVKYSAAPNVDWAVHALHRNRISPILASRDPNVTPSMLKRCFSTKKRFLFPKLQDRLLLSGDTTDGAGLMGAYLYREGLMPYVEAVIASRRLVVTSGTLTALSLGGSVIGILLCFYLLFTRGCAAVSPLLFFIYQLLFAVIGLLIGTNADRY